MFQSVLEKYNFSKLKVNWSQNLLFFNVFNWFFFSNDNVNFMK